MAQVSSYCELRSQAKVSKVVARFRRDLGLVFSSLSRQGPDPYAVSLALFQLCVSEDTGIRVFHPFTQKDTVDRRERERHRERYTEGGNRYVFSISNV